MSGVPKFMLQGVAQCWNCKHKDGAGVHHINGHWYLLPICEVCDTYMTIIYDPPCREFQREDET